MRSHRALIFGAQGLVGSRLLARLAAHDAYAQIEAPVRRPLVSLPPRVHAPRIDFDRLDDYVPSASPDHVFCCLGTTLRKAGSQEAFRSVDHDLVVAIARLALRHGARHLVFVSALGANPASGVFYNRVKGEAEADVFALSLPKVTALRPSLLAGDRTESRPAERAGLWLAKAIAPLLLGPLRRYRAVEADAVARAMIAIALAGAPTGAVESEAIAALAAATS